MIRSLTGLKRHWRLHSEQMIYLRLRLSVNRGIVATEQQQWDTARDWYQRGRETPGAEPDTRANAALGLGVLA